VTPAIRHGRSGTASVVLDVSGRLLLFAAVPEPGMSADEQAGSVERERWDFFLKRAKIDPVQMVAAEPGARSLYQGESAVGVACPHPGGGPHLVSVESMAWGDRPLFFAVSRSAEDSTQARHSESLETRATVRDWFRSYRLPSDHHCGHPLGVVELPRRRTIERGRCVWPSLLW